MTTSPSSQDRGPRQGGRLSAPRGCATPAALGRFAAWAFAASLTGLTMAAPATEPLPPGLMLRSGNWDGDIGTYEVPAALAKIAPRRWPADGWQRLSIAKDRSEMRAVPATGGRPPEFLARIAAQVMAASRSQTAAPAPAASGQDGLDMVLYLRLPGTRWASGEIKPIVFKNGTPQLTPKLDHRYALQLGDTPFAFTVGHGLKGRNGAGHGSGAQVRIEYDGHAYHYSLPEHGWDTKVGAIADLDSDGKPDFLITVGGNNTIHEYLLLSSQARPGRNPATAALMSTGC